MLEVLFAAGTNATVETVWLPTIRGFEAAGRLAPAAAARGAVELSVLPCERSFKVILVVALGRLTTGLEIGLVTSAVSDSVFSEGEVVWTAVPTLEVVGELVVVREAE